MAIKKIEGVESVNVSLNEGKARIQFKPGNMVRWNTIIESVKNKGFTPKEARVTAITALELKDGKARATIIGSNETFQPADQIKPARRALIQGVIAAPSDKKRLPIITITKVIEEKQP